MKVSLFIPCMVDTLVPEVGDAVVRTLRRVGLDLEYPEAQTCCGQPAFNAGYWEDARRVARQFLRAFAEAEVIVAPSGSCVSMVRNHYLQLFAEHPEELARAREIGSRVFELSEFLVRKLGVTDLGASFDGKLTYHDSCHLNRELGVSKEPRALIRAVKGAELIEMPDPDRCCGFGGAFSVKFPEISAAMARCKADNIQASGAKAVIISDPGCLIQVRGYFHRHGINVQALHIAELLAGQDSA
jgi:L-lactate dehydrogenase complex protein LldE